MLQIVLPKTADINERVYKTAKHLARETFRGRDKRIIYRTVRKTPDAIETLVYTFV